jgi:hypothetical protein
MYVKSRLCGSATAPAPPSAARGGCVLPESLRATAAAASSTADMRAVSRTPFQAREKGAAASGHVTGCAAACLPAACTAQIGRSGELIYPKSTRLHGRSISAGSPGRVEIKDEIGSQQKVMTDIGFSAAHGGC